MSKHCHISTCILIVRCVLPVRASVLVLPLGCDNTRVVLVNDKRPKYKQYCMSYRWTMALALEQIESQRAALQELKSHRAEPYDSAITTALDDSDNGFGLHSRVVVLWTDLLVDPANPQWSVRASEFCHPY